MHVVHSAADGEVADEAEYAWLPIDFIKPFHIGDVSGTEGAPPSEDPNLKASIAAAEAALRALHRSEARAQAADDDRGEVGALDSDSDGGWGPPVQPQAGRGGFMRGRMAAAGAGGAGAGSRGGRGRGGRGGGRGKGSRRGGAGGRGGRYSRGGSRGSDDEGFEDEASLQDVAGGTWDAVPSSSLPKQSVEAIFGWRYPLTDVQRQEQQQQQRSLDQQRMGLLAKISDTQGPATGSSMLPRPLPLWPGPVDTTLAPVDPMVLSPLGLPLSPLGQPAPQNPDEPEYLVKWQSKSHVHNEWVKESTLSQSARRLLTNFKRRHGHAPCQFVKPEWVVPERFVTRRPCPAGPGWEVLVKWTGLGYEAATWEVSCMGCDYLLQTGCSRMTARTCGRQL